MAGGVAGVVKKGPEFLGHPKGLYVLFFAEMWERFSYYGMRALLIFYLTKHWLFDDGKSNLIYGAYTSLVYITPVLGGYLADRFLGQRKAVTFGAVMLTLGHLLMAVGGEGGQGSAAINIFWLALAFIIVGTGFLKANISVIVGQLYPLTDPRRDGAYTIFYIGINTGAAIGTIMAGWLGETYGWSYGFGAAGVGMLLGLVVFILGKPLLLGKGEAPRPLAARTEWSLYGVGLASVGVIWALVQYQDVIQTLLIVSGIAMLGYVLFESFKLEPHARDRMFAVLFLIALNPVFWGLFEQAGGSLNLYTDRFVDRGDVPASLFQSINPIYIVLLGPIFAALWVFLGKRGLEPSAPAKFGLALAQVGLSFLVFVWGAQSVGLEVATPVFFVFAIYFLQTTGELCLSPVGLSAMNRLAPKHLASLIMGAWFYMTAVGNFVAGKIGEATGGESGEMTKEGTLAIYSTIGWWTIGIAVAVLALSPLVRRWMHLDTLRDDVDHAMAGEAELAEPKAAGLNTSGETRR
ncbi:peptide MFS transporter [Sphingomonas mucosissima]|uniref:peptide MFS transporter n=1 Tax=Sphingomonas mucosissima TaxID=370959 RepID=UPI001FE7CE53|nr:peptide MFS transporter [Sphingomonas mucosissima]